MALAILRSRKSVAPWTIVAASLLAMCVGAGPITFFPNGSFLPPMTHEFGWSRAEYFIGFALGGVLSAVAAPMIGAMGDRWGIRRILLPGILLYALANALLAGLNGSLVQYVMVSIAAGVLSVVQSPTFYVKAISRRFGANRGLAIGIALSGTGIGAAFIMPLVSAVIEQFGWRAARLSLSLLLVLLAWPAVYFFFRGEESQQPERGLASAAEPGMTARQACRTATLWILCAIFLLSAAAVNGIVSNLVPMLHDRGLGLVVAGSMVSSLAIAQIAGRIGCGAMLDWAESPKAGMVWFACGIAGILVVGVARNDAAYVAGSALIGLALGAEVQLAAYYTTRFFGIRQFGRLYGIFFGCFTIGTAVGPAVVGMLYDLSRNYHSAIWTALSGLAVCCVLLASLGPYRFGKEEIAPLRPQVSRVR